MSKVFEHGCCIAENEAVIVHDHDPQGMRRPAILRCAIRDNAGVLDFSYRQPKLSRCAPPLLACQDQPRPTLLGKAVHHGKPEPCSLADAFRREERLDRPRQGCFIHAVPGVGHRYADETARRAFTFEASPVRADMAMVPPSGIASRAFTTRFRRANSN